MNAINHVAVWAAGIVQFLLGAGWYTAFAKAYGFEARPLSPWLINAGYMIVGMALMGAIVGHWRKRA